MELSYIRAGQHFGPIQKFASDVLPDMSPSPIRCPQSEMTCAYALQALPASEIAAAEAHIASCPDCQRELEALRPVVDRFVSWPTDVLRPSASLQARLALRIAEETGRQPVPPPPTAAARAGMGAGRARDRMQAARDRH